MKSRSTICSLVFVVMQFLLVSKTIAAPAPDITQFDIIQVCTEYECVDTTVSPYYVSIIGGSQITAYVRQIGYASYQGGTYNSNTVYSASSTITQAGNVIGFLDIYDCNSNQSGTFSVKARSTNTSQEWTASIYIAMNPIMTVTKLGVGSGTVTPDSGSLNWSGNVGTGH